MRGMGVALTSGRTALAPSPATRPPMLSRRSGRGSTLMTPLATLTSPPPSSTSTSSPRRPTSSSPVATPPTAVVLPPRPKVPLTGREVEEHAMRSTVAWMRRWESGDPTARPPPPLLSRDKREDGALARAYAACGEITADYAKTFYLGTKLMTPEKARAIWAIYVWCRRTDELVDGPNAPRMTPAALDRWEERLEAAWRGKPYDVLDAALSDTVAAFPVDIQPFRDMIDGMRMDLTKARYATYEELYEYCYCVAGAVGLMTTPIMGVAPAAAADPEPTLRAALALGTANQLTNILRDVGEDAQQRNRVYVPLEDLDRFGIAEAEVVSGSLVKVLPGGKSEVDPRWKAFMAFQITRARACFADAEAGIGSLDADARWPVWSALILYRQILDAIEKNDYDNFTKRAYVDKWRKYASLPAALMRARQGL